MEQLNSVDLGVKKDYIRNPYSCLEPIPDLIRSGAQEFIGQIQQKLKMLVDSGEWDKRMNKSITGDKNQWMSSDYLLWILSSRVCKDFRVDQYKDQASVVFEPVRTSDWSTVISASVYGYKPYIAGARQTKDYPWESLDSLNINIYIPALPFLNSVCYDGSNVGALPDTYRELFDSWKDTLLNWNESTAARFDKEVEGLVKQAVTVGLVAIRKKEGLADDFLSILRQSQRYFLRISNNLNVEKPDQLEGGGNDWETNRSPMSGSLRLKYGFFESMMADVMGDQKIIDFAIVTELTKLLTFTTFGDVDFVSHWQSYRENPMLPPIIRVIIDEWYNSDRYNDSWWVMNAPDPTKSQDHSANATSTVARMIFNVVSLAVGYIAQKMLLEKALRLGAPNIEDRTKKFFINEKDMLSLTWKEMRVSTQVEAYIGELRDSANQLVTKIRNLIPSNIIHDTNILHVLVNDITGKRNDFFSESSFEKRNDLVHEEVFNHQTTEYTRDDPHGRGNMCWNPFNTYWIVDSLERAINASSSWRNMSSDFIGSRAYQSMTRGRRLVTNTIDRSWEALDDMVWKSLEADEVKAMNTELGSETEAPLDLKTGVQPGDVDPKQREDEVLGQAADEEVEKFISMEKDCEKSQESLYVFKF